MKRKFFLVCFFCTCLNFAQEWNKKNDFAASGSINLLSFTIDNKAYVIDTFDAKLYKYQTDTDTWNFTTIEWMRDKGYQDGFALPIGDRAFVAPGLPSDPNESSKVFYEFNPNTETWTQLADLPSFIFHSSVPIPNFSFNNVGYFLLLGKMYSYDPNTTIWTDKESRYPGGSYYFNTAHFSINNKFYVGSGTNSALESSSNFFKYNPENNSWEQIANYPYSRAPSSMISFVINEIGYTGLGTYSNNNGFEYDSQFYSYSPSNDIWSAIPDCKYSAKASFSFTLNGKGYVGAGWRTSPFEVYHDIWEFTPIALHTKSNSIVTTKIYPNPAQNFIHIDSREPIKEVKIYSINGSLIKNTINSRINISNLPSGLYFIDVLINTKIVRKKFIKI
ncbi:T9SS type A sorting domain-containing protein [uncultured Algibacter sp.]|uniref:T9SS type A sorting domain-containing protein n=1 Tax=uncultured Algibacter sp. TaxID=298659 RepID=UPI002603DF93|nr:T9SS type A sorting domain-containing protein [uncultured Algibacter sp.]